MGSEDKERWQRIALLFDRAVSLSAEDRTAFLDHACEGDDDLRQRVVELLRSSDRASGFLGQPFTLTDGSILRPLADGAPSDSSAPPPADPSQTPTHTQTQSSLAKAAELIGPYRLLGKIGEGGMGEVWRAEQSGPIRRQVALKVIKSGMDTRQVVARFEAERQALAFMDHPVIARVYDAGETPRGLPYFVMELVPGEPITSYCDRQRLTVRQRLDLFTQVCEGVQHAHQRGIIHRDLKPSNVLVAVEGERPAPKIIDFGVAKATAAQLGDKHLYTELGMMIGTPEYMSPEQAEMTAAGVDTRTDVYSLGVILYELLTGTLPFDSLREAGHDEIRRRIRETDPPKPSTRVSSLGERLTTVAERRGTEPARLVSGLKGELDWIVLRAMEKDRTRRYGSPGELAADIERSLRNEPVLAGPPGGFYRARHFSRRHRLGVAITTAAAMGLVAFALTMWVQTVRIAKERDRADREAQASSRVTDYLTGLFRVADPAVNEGRTITARELLARGAESIRKDLKNDPLIQARLMLTIGEIYLNLGLYKDAEPYLEKSVSERRRLLGPEHPDTLMSMHTLASDYDHQGKIAQAEKLARETLDLRRRVLGAEDRATLYSATLLGRIYAASGRPRDAVALLEESLGARGGSPDRDNSLAADILVSLGLSNLTLGRYPAAESQFREALERRLRPSGKENLVTLGTRNFCGWTCFLQGKFDDARTLFHEGFEVSRKQYGPDHRDTLRLQAGLAAASFFVGSREDAMAMQRQLVETSRRVFGPQAGWTNQQIFSLGMMTLHEHKYPQAEELFRKVSDTSLRRTDPDTLWALNYLAVAARHNGKLEEAERILQRVVEVSPGVLGPEHPRTRESMRQLAEVYEAEERYSEAEKLYKEALAEVPPETWQDPRVRSASLFGLAGLESRRGERALALDHLRQAVTLGFDDPEEFSRNARLASLRSDPAFGELAAAAEANSRRLPASPTP